MTNIPFPNPHDADALNDYLDDLAAGEQATPVSDVETAAQAFHQLASRAEVGISTQRTVEQPRGEETMHTATLAAPVSNRTRRQMTAAEKKPGRSYGWLSAVIVAGLMISMIGSAWLNREPGNPHDQLAFAPGTATAISEDEVLTPESAPWIADFDPADCTETSGLERVQIVYVDVTSQGYAPIGPAALDDAADAASQYRAMRACPAFAGAWAYWSEARIQEHPRVFDETASVEITELQEQFADVYPEQFMVVADDLSVSSDVKTEWNARLEVDQLGLPIPLDAKVNPDWGVELSDGRIAFPATIMYSAQDPALVANGLPIDTPASTVAMIFTLEDGSWKYDDSLQLCLVNCDSGIGNSAEMKDIPASLSFSSAQCTLEEMTTGEYRERMATLPEVDHRSYVSAGTPVPTVADEIVTNFDQFGVCSAMIGDYSMYPLFTDLGMFSWVAQSTPNSEIHEEIAPILRENDIGSANILANTPQWHQVDIVGAPIHREIVNGMKPERWWDAEDTNDAMTWPAIGYADPARAVLLEDGRVALTTTTTISTEDRGAIRYEGDISMFPVPIVIYAERDGTWLIDGIATVPRHNGQITPSQSWWWDSAFDDDPVATPQSVEPTPTNVPRGGDNRG